MRILFTTGTPARYMAPPMLGTEQIVCGPDWADAREHDGRWRSLQTPVSRYDLRTVLERLGDSQRPDAVVCLVDASWRSLPQHLSGFRGPKILLVADTHHMTGPITQMLRYAGSEPFDRVVFIYDRHHVPIFRAAGLKNIYWFPGLTFPHDDQTVRASERPQRAPHLAFVGQAGQFHPRRARLLSALSDAGVPVVQKRLSQRESLAFYGSSLVGFNASLNGDLNLRVFEILASGATLLTDRLSPGSGLFSLWQEGRELVTYGSPEELNERAHHLLQNPSRAREIGRAGATWFAQHFSAARRREAFERLMVTGETVPEFDLPNQPALRINFPGQAKPKAVLEFYEGIQELHRTQESVRVALDADVPQDFAALCATLPRVKVSCGESADADPLPDWRIVDRAHAGDAIGRGEKVWCWNEGSAIPAPTADETPHAVRVTNLGEKPNEPSLALQPEISFGETARASTDGQRTKRILIYTDEPAEGGVAHYNHSVLVALSEAGWETVHAMPPRAEASPLIAEQARRGTRHLWLSYNPGDEFPRSFVDTTDPARIFAAAQPDLVYFSDCCALSNIAAKHVALKRRIPFVVICHSGAAYLAKRFAQCLPVVAKQLNWASNVITVAESSLRVLRHVYGLASNRGVVIHNGRPAHYFLERDPSTRARLRAELAVPDSAMLCLTAARCDLAKGYQFQLQAIAQLRKMGRLKDLYFAWAGDGKVRGDLEKLSTTLEVKDRIRFLGQRWDIPELMEAADAFVLTTMNEAMPLSIMEAMAKGLPVAATAVGGVPEEMGETGMLLPDPNVDPVGTVTQLSEVLMKWSADPTLRQRVGLAGKTRAKQLFREDVMIEKTVALLEEAVSGKEELTAASH